MAGVLSRTIRKRKKSATTAESSVDLEFPLRELPYELQLMIGRECVLRSVSIIVGKNISRWHSDPAEELDARTCHNMLQVSKDFRKELYRTYYEDNMFELGYYYERNNFLQHPGSRLVRHVSVDALRALVQPVGVPSSIPENLKSLPALKCLSIRLRVSLLQQALREDALGGFIKRLCRMLSLEKIQLLIERTGNSDEENNAAFDKYKKFVDESLTTEKVWPSGIPTSRRMPQFVVKWDYVTAAGLQRYALRKGGKQAKPSKIMSLVNNGMRRLSISSDTATPNQTTTNGGTQADTGYFIAST